MAKFVCHVGFDVGFRQLMNSNSFAFREGIHEHVVLPAGDAYLNMAVGVGYPATELVDKEFGVFLVCSFVLVKAVDEEAEGMAVVELWVRYQP